MRKIAYLPSRQRRVYGWLFPCSSRTTSGVNYLSLQCRPQSEFPDGPYLAVNKDDGANGRRRRRELLDKFSHNYQCVTDGRTYGGQTGYDATVISYRNSSCWSCSCVRRIRRFKELFFNLCLVSTIPLSFCRCRFAVPVTKIP